jgi:hypothetical protein
VGTNVRYRNQPGRIPVWAATVGLCRRNGTRVKVACTHCKLSRPARLKIMERELGPDFSLWDIRPRCREPGCDGRAIFIYSPRRGTPFRPMRTRDLTFEEPPVLGKIQAGGRVEPAR